MVANSIGVAFSLIVFILSGKQKNKRETADN